MGAGGDYIDKQIVYFGKDGVKGVVSNNTVTIPGDNVSVVGSVVVDGNLVCGTLDIYDGSLIVNGGNVTCKYIHVHNGDIVVNKNMGSDGHVLEYTFDATEGGIKVSGSFVTHNTVVKAGYFDIAGEVYMYRNDVLSSPILYVEDKLVLNDYSMIFGYVVTGGLSIGINTGDDTLITSGNKHAYIAIYGNLIINGAFRVVNMYVLRVLGNLHVKYNVHINGNLNVAGNIFFNKDAYINGNLIVGGKDNGGSIIAKKNLFVEGVLHYSGRAEVHGILYVYEHINSNEYDSDATVKNLKVDGREATFYVLMYIGGKQVVFIDNRIFAVRRGYKPSIFETMINNLDRSIGFSCGDVMYLKRYGKYIIAMYKMLKELNTED